MEPCIYKAGIICEPKELGTIADVLQDYANDANVYHTVNTAEVVRDLQNIRDDKGQFFGPAFIPAEEALTVAKILDEQAMSRKLASRPIVVSLGMMGALYIPSTIGRTKHPFAKQIEKNVDRSRSLQS